MKTVLSDWLTYNMEAISRRIMEGRVQKRENSKTLHTRFTNSFSASLIVV